MPIPKSVTKVTRDGNITFTSSVDAVQYTIRELSRGALRDVGKYLKKQYNLNFYKQVKKHKGLGGRMCQYWARSKEIDLQIGLGKNKGSQAGFYNMFFETGSEKTPKLDILRNTVYNNIDKIQEIEGQYLSELNKDVPSLNGLSESDYESDD